MAILVEADKVWEYFKKREDDLTSDYATIAMSDDEAVLICVTEHHGFPQIVVFEDGEDIFEEVALSPLDCAQTSEYAYDIFLNGWREDFGAETEDDKPEVDEEKLIQFREDELSDAVYAMLDTVLLDSKRGYLILEDLIEPVKDLICEHLARHFNLDIYRPMMLEDEEGEEFFTEYPYDCMVFDDEQEKKGA